MATLPTPTQHECSARRKEEEEEEEEEEPKVVWLCWASTTPPFPER